MASAWGATWGLSWGDSWGGAEQPPAPAPPVHAVFGGGSETRRRVRRRVIITPPPLIEPPPPAPAPQPLRAVTPVCDSVQVEPAPVAVELPSAAPAPPRRTRARRDEELLLLH